MIYVYGQGGLLTIHNLVEAENIGLKATKKQKQGIRGRITEFTRKSRKRLMMELAKVKKQGLVFVTLTFAINMQDNETAKKKLHNFNRHLQRKYPKCWYFWKLEHQKRGAIHYHLLVGGISYKNILMFTKKYWKEGFSDVKQANKNSIEYFSKYISKKENIEHECGRFWGVFNKSMVDFELITRYNICNQQKKFLKKLFAYKRVTNKNYKIQLLV